MRSIAHAAALLLLAASGAAAQQPTVGSPDEQITAAVAALPEEFRESATVLGYQPGSSTLVRLRAGIGPFNCLADDPADERFHVACYHQSLEAFMARGRELRTTGVTGAGIDSVRFAEIEAGRLVLPAQPAALYSLTGQPGSPGLRPLYVVYIPFATTESTGLPKTPAANMPWLMFPGSPKAHIMFVPSM